MSPSWRKEVLDWTFAYLSVENTSAATVGYICASVLEWEGGKKEGAGVRGGSAIQEERSTGVEGHGLQVMDLL